MIEPAYIVEDNHVTPTEHARGPWFDDQQHGACLLGLITRFMEQLPSPQPMRFTRVVVDLSRSVPMVPFTVEARARRDGKRVQSLEAAVLVDGEIRATAVATRIRFEPGLVPASIPRPVHDEDVAPTLSERAIDYTMSKVSFQQCLEVRSDDDLHDEAATWIRLATSLVEGEEPSPAVRVAAVADLLSGPAPYVGRDWIAINPEVTFQLEREPVGEWIGLQNSIRFADDGIGMSEAVLFDTEKRIGRSSKSTIIYPR